MRGDSSPHKELPSNERIEEYVAGARRVLVDDLPAGHKLWKSWALDLADNVLALARKLDSTQEQLEASVPRDFSISQQEEIVRLEEQLEAERGRADAQAELTARLTERVRSAEEQLEAMRQALTDTSKEP